MHHKTAVIFIFLAPLFWKKLFFLEVSIDPDLTHSRLHGLEPVPHVLIYLMLGKEIFGKQLCWAEKS